MNDDAVALPPDATRIGIAHPVDLGRDLCGRWGEVLADYEVLQPFAQIGRPILEASAPERAGSRITRYAGRLASGRRFFALKARGWEFSDYDFGKRLGGGLIACLASEPGLDFLAYDPGEQTLGDLYLTGGASFGALSALDMSELLYDVESLL